MINIFFNESFLSTSEIYFLSSGNILLFGAFYLLLETMIEIRRESILTEKYFPASGNHFQFFCQKKQFLRIVETYFSTNASFRVVETDFLASTNCKFFFRLVETYVLMNPSFQLLEKDFHSRGSRLLYLRVLS